LHYLFLRASTAGGALVAGLIQTFVFARVLSPDNFSIFIIVGTLGMSLWIFDLGISKILFVNLRPPFLARADTSAIARQANAVALLYGALSAGGSVLCFMVIRTGTSVSGWQAFECTLFFLFCSLNLVWFVFRNLSIAVDEFIYFEWLEATRRFGYIALMLAMLVGLPFATFLIAVNLLWAVLFTLAVTKLLPRRALTPKLAGSFGELRNFFRDNGRAALRTGIHAAGELYFHNVLYLAVPLVFGLGAPTIVLDTTIKIFYGTLVLCTAACDLLVPRQTRAFAEHDTPTLLRATLAAAGLCALPAAFFSGILWYDASRLFALLLGPAATMPPAVTPILTVLLAAAAARTACNYLLQHTGFFKEISRLSIIISIAMTAAVLIAAVARLDIIGFLAVYAVIHAGSALLYVIAAIRGPIRIADAGLSPHGVQR
jgi:O-antigen/teichoic acid export membrane protein